MSFSFVPQIQSCFLSLFFSFWQRKKQLEVKSLAQLIICYAVPRMLLLLLELLLSLKICTHFSNIWPSISYRRKNKLLIFSRNLFILTAEVTTFTSRLYQLYLASVSQCFTVSSYPGMLTFAA